MCLRENLSVLTWWPVVWCSTHIFFSWDELARVDQHNSFGERLLRADADGRWQESLLSAPSSVFRRCYGRHLAAAIPHHRSGLFPVGGCHPSLADKL
jgi:hypothetical protein